MARGQLKRKRVETWLWRERRKKKRKKGGHTESVRKKREGSIHMRKKRRGHQKGKKLAGISDGEEKRGKKGNSSISTSTKKKTRGVTEGKGGFKTWSKGKKKREEEKKRQQHLYLTERVCGGRRNSSDSLIRKKGGEGRRKSFDPWGGEEKEKIENDFRGPLAAPLGRKGGKGGRRRDIYFPT